MSDSNLLEPFKIALALEREGKRLFIEAARTTESKLARQTFEFLAAEEDKHIEKIEKFYSAMEKSGGKEIPQVEESQAEEKLESFNVMLEGIKDEFRATASDVEAYRMALEFEGGTEDFYAERLAQAADPRIQRFYRWLIAEETMHSRLLRSCLQFVEDPAEWFKKRRR